MSNKLRFVDLALYQLVRADEPLSGAALRGLQEIVEEAALEVETAKRKLDVEVRRLVMDELASRGRELAR